MNHEIIKKRSQITENVRRFFKDRNYLEVDTPLLSPDLIPESSIEIFKTELINPYRGNRDLFLIPSPEIWMKKLLSQGSGDIFQICKSFRNSEQSGIHHNSEFTMLEWYKTGFSYMDNIKETEDLFHALTTEHTPENLKPPFRKMTMEEAFLNYTGYSLEKNYDESQLEELCRRLNIETEQGDNWEVLFNRIFLQMVEPSLPQDKPLVLYNYPSRIKTLAKDLPGTIWSERWELYGGGMELANCFSEEKNPSKIKEYYKEEKAYKDEISPVSHPVNDHYHEYFGPHFPDCSGVALGMDRLIMLFTGETSIQRVILFPQK
ncbi:MAG: EF-P lysine aminoacylase GenX [Spirochaetaceae bacterium]|nr:EF-P lysine aminoacylase GenX [Spirochaetaceae bacterium]